MKIAFLSECNFTGQYPRNFPNSRTDVAWQIALKATHHPISEYKSVSGYDYVVVILPKGHCTVDSAGTSIVQKNKRLLCSSILHSDITSVLKSNNKKLCFMQEGPTWYFNDYELADQIAYVNFIDSCDMILCHNKYDISFYKGLSSKPIRILPTLMIEDSIKDIDQSIERSGCMIGGNCSHWYGGFHSYLMALNFDCDLYIPSMHCRREGEEKLERLHHLSYLTWVDWIKELNKRKYAIHLMPTVAAGTFSLNCAYLGIPCIGNKCLDTQNCFRELSVDVNDLNSVKKKIEQLRAPDFYEHISLKAKEIFRGEFSEEMFLCKMEEVFI